MKKLLLLAICITIVLTLASCRIDEEENSIFTFSKSENGEYYTVTGIKSFDGENLEFPETYNDLPVTEIKMSNITSSMMNTTEKINEITIPKSISTIDIQSFSNFTNLKIITVDEGNEAFKSVDGVLYSKNGENLILYPKAKEAAVFTIPEGVVLVNYDAIQNNNLKEIHISSTVTSIDNNRVVSMENIFSTDFSDKIQIGTNGDYAILAPNYSTNGDFKFEYSGSTGDYVIIDKVTNSTINSSAPSYSITTDNNLIYTSNLTYYKGPFSNCNSLNKITVSENNEKFKDIDGNLYTTDGKLLKYIASNNADTFEVPEDTTAIGEYAFYNCKNLIHIVLPSSVKSINNYAFSNCSSLTEIELSPNITSIGNGAFNGCTTLSSIVIPEGVTNIKSNTFCGCKSLKTVSIPSSVTSIGGYAFSECESLTSIVIPENIESISDYAFKKCQQLTIYCKLADQPEKWEKEWNSDNLPVVWGFEE